MDNHSTNLLLTQLEPTCGPTGDAQMNDLLRDYKRWNYVERVAVAVVVAIAAVVVAVGLF